jgi:hypothetical protein
MQLTDLSVVWWQHADVGSVHLPHVSVVQHDLHHVLLEGDVKRLNCAGKEAVVRLAPVHAHPGAVWQRSLGIGNDLQDLDREDKRSV